MTDTSGFNCDSCTVMVVDDQVRNLQLFERLLGQERFKVLPFTGGEGALRALASVRPDVIVLDIKMPGLSGWEFNERLKADTSLAKIPVLFLSGISDVEAKGRAFASGGVDYITKPFQPGEVIARIKTHVRFHRMKQQLAHYNEELETRVEEQVREISDSQRATITALARLAESRDDDTGQHILRVQRYCRILADGLRRRGEGGGIDGAFIEDLFHASALHDIGKVAIPDAVLLKPGKLTKDEFETMKRHTILGAMTLERIIQDYPRNRMLVLGQEICRHHHERWDGSGYPDGLAGHGIPLAARSMAVGDVYDALRSRRPYKEPMPHEQCVKIIRDGKGTQFDPTVVDCFIELEDDFRRCGNGP